MKLLLFLLINFSAINSGIDSVRALYLTAYINQENCEKFREKISKMENQNTSLIKGYKGCFYFIKCKFTNNPVKKIKYFDKGKHLLERAINDDPKSVELKFLRYSIQKNLPKFLLYYENIEKDLNFVKKNITNLKDEKTRKFITTSLKAISK